VPVYAIVMWLSLMPLLVSANDVLNRTRYALFNGRQPAAPVRVLDALLIETDRVDGLPVVELSDIAWDQRNQLLYAVSDDGYLFTLALDIRSRRLLSARFLAGYRLRDKQGRRLTGDASDAEGLDIAGWNARGEPELLVSFEHGARIWRYSPAGRYLGKVRLPTPLRKKRGYRGANHMLEGVVSHPGFGVLTAAERPLRRDSKKVQSLYAMDGRQWRFKAWKRKKGAITSLEVLPDGNVLLLERAWKGVPAPVHIRLRKLWVMSKPEGGQVKANTLAVWNGGEGWRLDNFEGLAHYRDGLFLLVSDNNEALYQNTLLVLIEVNVE